MKNAERQARAVVSDPTFFVGQQTVDQGPSRHLVEFQLMGKNACDTLPHPIDRSVKGSRRGIVSRYDGARRFQSIEDFADIAKSLPVPWTLGLRSERFSASIRTQQIGPAQLADIRFDPCLANRASRAAASEAHTCLTVLLDGSQGIFWEDREIFVVKSELILWDDSQPMHIENSSPAHMYNLWFPTRIFEQRVGPLHPRTGFKIPATRGIPKVLVDHLHSIFVECKSISVHQQLGALNSIFDLISLCFASNEDPGRKRGRCDEILAAAKREIAVTTDLEHLTPKFIATKLGTSVRTLQSAFFSNDETFSAFVLATKLERAKYALASENFSGLSITEIAHWFGFFDASHFGRSFKAKLGCTPSVFRKSFGRDSGAASKKKSAVD